MHYFLMFHLSYSVFVFLFSFNLIFWCRALDQDGPFVSSWAHLNIPYHILFIYSLAYSNERSGADNFMSLGSVGSFVATQNSD